MKGNKDITMKDFEELVNKVIEEGELGIAVLIEMPGFDEPEIIINPPVNLVKKLAYYKETYDDNLEHKHAKGVKILAVSSM